MRVRFILSVLIVLPAALAADLDFGLTGIAPVQSARVSTFCSDDAPLVPKQLLQPAKTLSIR